MPWIKKKGVLILINKIVCLNFIYKHIQSKKDLIMQEFALKDYVKDEILN